MSGPNERNMHNPDGGDERIAAMLDRLGEAERSGADGLEERIMGSVARVFAPEPIAMVEPRGAWWQRTPVRLAAGLVIAAGVGIGVYSSLPGTNPGADPGVDIALVEQRIDGLLAMADGGDGFGDSLASIELWAEALDAEIGDGWLGSDLTSGLGDLNLGGGAL